MKTLSFSLLSLFSAIAVMAETPKGLADSDWGSIRAAYEAGRHQFHRQEDGTHAARNPVQGWKMAFDARGFSVTPDDGSWSWGLELVADASGAPQPVAMPVEEVPGKKNTLTFKRTAAIEEWYVNDQRGLEQGWTLSAPAEIRLKVRGGLKPSVSAQTVSFGSTVNYGGLKAWDKNGRPVQSWFESAEDGFTVRYDDAGAQYPITIDPIAQQAYLKASNTGSYDSFGYSVAASGDTVIVGALGEASSTTGVNSTPNENAYASGAAYVFVRSGNTWVQQAYLKASNPESYDQFGTSVAIHGDSVIIGAFGEDSSTTGVNSSPDEGASSSGAAYVFVRNAGTWTQQAYLKASNPGSGDEFGRSVGIAGEMVVVGAEWENSSTTGVNSTPNGDAPGSGAAYVFARNGTTWSQEAYLKASNTGGDDRFGKAVAVSADTVVVGAHGEASSTTGVNSTPNESAFASGAAYAFVRGGSTWTQQAYLKASNTDAYDGFGSAVSISGDSLVVGAKGEDSSTTGVNGLPNEFTPYSGAAYVFVRSNGNWSQQAFLKASNPSIDDSFGSSVAISGDTVVVGADQEDSSSTGVNSIPNEGASRSGAAYVFVRGGVSWSQQAYLKASNTGADDLFGRSVAVDGNTVIVGADGEDSSTTGVNSSSNNSAVASGAVYLFPGVEAAAYPDIEVSITGIPVSNGWGWSFGEVTANGSNVTFPIRVKNVGTAALAAISASISGTDSSQFSIVTTPVPSIPIDGITTLEVRFQPSTPGFKGALLRIESNDPDENPYLISLGGTGIIPDIQLSSGGNVFSNGSSGSFGSVNANGSYVSGYLVITNTGSADLTGVVASLLGSDITHFSIVNAPLATIEPQNNSVFELRFQPSSPGQKSVLLRIASNDPDENPYEITLTGTGLAAPTAPVLLSPGTKTAPGPTLTTLTPTFAWKAVSGAVGYIFTLREAGGTLLHAETAIGAVTSYTLPAGHLRPGGRYRWTMQARNAAGPGMESAPFYFVVSDEPAAVPQPVLLTPGSRDPTKTVLNTLTPTFRWKAVTGALGLRFTLRDTGSDSDVPLHQNDAVGTGTSYTLPAGVLQPDKTYRWTLRGRNALGEGRWALPFYFSTAPAVTLPIAPVPVYPGGTSLAGATVYDPGAAGAKLLEWKPVTGATGYKVKLWPAGAGAELHSADVAAGTVTYSLPSGLLTQNQACRWTVSTVVGGLESLPSASRFFRTPAVYPAPVITSFRPAQVVASTGAQWVLLQGDDFRSGAKVLQTYGTKTDLLASSGNVQFYPAGIRVRIITGMVAGNWTFKVVNPDGKVSNAVTLPVVLPASTALTPPVATPPPGTYDQPVSVVLSQSNGAGVNIHYTDNGSLPDLSSPIYDTEPILLGAKTPVRLQAVALDETRTAARMVPATYRFNLPQLKFEASNEAKQFFAGDKYYYKVVVPAGLASFDLQTIVPQGRVDLYLAKDRLPTVESHQFKSVPEPGSGGDEVQAIRSQRVTEGTYFVLVHAKDSARVQIGMVATKGTVTAQPTISPGKGAHAAPLQVSIKHPDPYATIYYTVDSSAPNPMAAKMPDAGNLGSGTLIYRGAFLLSSNAYVSAVAQTPGQSVSKPVWADYTMNQYYGFFDMPLTEDPMDIPLMPPTWSAETPLEVSWSDKVPPVEHSFAFTVPPDPINVVGAPSSYIQYPVAVLFLLQEPGDITLNISLSPSATLAGSSKYPIVIKELPALDQEVASYYVLGPKQANRGAELVPGTKYYGRISIKGSKQAAKNTVMAKLRMTLHYASLNNDAGNILPGKHSWVVAHGRDNTDSSPDIVDLGNALDDAIVSRPEVGEQVLRLNWGSMASASGFDVLWVDSLEASTDEAMFTEPVGRRTAEVMKKWGITPDKSSLIGHSWGTYVCYEFAKSTKSTVQRLIALDPAFTGTGGYADSQINFRKYAKRSWAFVSDYSLNLQPLPYGNSSYAGTAHESFFVGPSMGDPLQLHALPLELFTEFLTRAYSVAPTDPVANFFAIDKLDGVPLARFKENDWPFPLRPHEGSITVGHGPDADHALDVSAPITLRYTNKALQLQTLTSPGRTP